MDYEPKVRKLEMIQGIMTRMAQNSFSLKGWAITLVSGIFILASRDAKVTFFLIAYIPTILFWFLDSYYLQLERQFKVLYISDSIKDPNRIDFDITRPETNYDDKTKYTQCLFAVTEWLFYIPIAVLIAVVIIITIPK